MKTVLVILIGFVFFLSGCGVNEPDSAAGLDMKPFDSKTIKEAVADANKWRKSNPKVTSFINQRELVITLSDNTEYRKKLDDDETFAAIAPYINSTHDCATHYFSSCDAELKEETFYLKATDEENIILYDGNITSLNNGFFELWLPRNRTITLHIEYEGRKVDEMITTFSESNTCITTAKLE